MFDYSEKEGGYGWCVATCSFLLHAVVSGLAYSCGVTHLIFQNYFNNPTHFVTSWIGAVMLGMCVLAGIPGTLLTYKIGYRMTVILGGLLAAGGMVISAFCTEFYQVLLSFGAMSGLGFGIAIIPSLLILENYFFVKRTFAVSYAVAGSGLGLTLLPVATYHLEEKFAWKGMAFIFAGLCLNICLCGVSMRPQQPHTLRERRGLLKIFEPGLCHSSAFVALCIVNFLWSFGSVIIFMYLPGYAMHMGQSMEDSVILMGVVGLSSFISRPIFQLFTHSAKLDHTSVFLCTVVMSAILTGLHPEMFLHKAGQIGYAIIFGMHAGFWTTFIAYLATELIGEEYVGLGRGFTSICIGMGLVSGGPLAGWVLDEMDDDYEVIFYLAGACLLLSSFILAIANFKKCYFRPMANWCDTDSESSSGSRAINTCTDEEIVLMTTESYPPMSGGVLPCFASAENATNMTSNAHAQNEDLPYVTNRDVPLKRPESKHAEAESIPCFTNNDTQTNNRPTSQHSDTEVLPCFTTLQNPQDGVMLRAKGSQMTVREFRLSSIDKSPESEV